MRIGSFGQTVFSVSTDRVLTPSSFSDIQDGINNLKVVLSNIASLSRKAIRNALVLFFGNLRGVRVTHTAGNDFLSTSTQKAINVDKGGMLNLSGYSGSGMTLANFGTLTDKLLTSGSTGTVSGLTITDVNTSTALQDVANAHAALPGAVVDGAAGISSGAAAVGGLVARTSVSGGTSLALTGQGTSNGKLAQGDVALDNAIFTLGNTAGGSTGGTLAGNIDASASSSANTINVVNGAYIVTGELKGGTGIDSVTIASKSRIPGVGSKAELETQVVDYMTYQDGIGFDVQNDSAYNQYVGQDLLIAFYGCGPIKTKHAKPCFFSQL